MMKYSYRITLIAISLMLILAVGSGCAHKKTHAESEVVSPAVETTDLGTSDMGNAMGLKTVSFNYDSSLLSAAAKSTLNSDAEILKSHSTVMIQVEGHCDARGGIQYNIALGQKRADAVQHYLDDLGVSQSRISTISYGKEKPLVVGDSEEAYAKNRRANLVITKK